MTVLSTYGAFRWTFSVGLAFEAGDELFDNAPLPDTIECSVTNLVTRGVRPGMRLEVTGSGAGNDGVHLIAGVAEHLLTMDTSVALNYEALLSQKTWYVYDLDGHRLWPASYVRMAGFSDGFTQINDWNSLNNYVQIYPAGYTADAAKGVAEYNWYLSQRTDIPSSQPIAIVQYPDTPTQSFSGIARLNLAGMAVGNPVSSDQRRNGTKYCHLYCQKLSAGAGQYGIQWLDLSRELG